MALFNFYDMFAGIGAFHLAAVRNGGKCVGACDIDPFARRTYEEWHGFKPKGDIRTEVDNLPDKTDFLFAGFPCPTFSIAGKSKLLSLGRRHGLEEQRRGTLIFRVEEVVRASAERPRVIILENVKHLLHHDNGRTLQTILNLFAGPPHYYEAKKAVLNALNFGTPQNRERLFIVLFRDGVPDGFALPAGNGQPRPAFRDYLDDDVLEKYTVGPGTWATLERHKKHHASKGNGFGYRLLAPEDPRTVCPTISARYHKDGAEALVPNRPRPRRLTPTEIQRIFGFPDDLRFLVSDTQAYRQLGNSIVVNVAEAVVGAVVKTIYGEDEKPATDSGHQAPALAV